MFIVHIGLPKSGSTTIQTFLDSNEEALRALSIDYSRIGRLRRRAHHNFVHELRGRVEKFNPVSGTVARLAAELSLSEFKNTIISSELFAACEGREVARLAKALSGIEQPIRVVLIIRNLVDLAPSSYAQKIRYGMNTYGFDEFFEIMLAQDKFNPYDIANKWGEAFGKDAVRVRVLDPALLLNGDLIDDFLATVGLDPDLPPIRALQRQERVNESTGWRALEAVRALFSDRSGLDDRHPLKRRVKMADTNFQKRRIGEAAEAVAAEIGWNKDRGRYLTRAQAQRLHDDYVVGVRRLNETLAEKLPEPRDLDARGFVERKELPDVGQIAAADLKSFYDAVAERLIVLDHELADAKASAA